MLSVTIQTAFGGNATGTITFLDGTTSLGTATVTSNAAQLSLSSLSAGSHSINANFAANWFAPGGLVKPAESALNQIEQITMWRKEIGLLELCP